MKLMDGINGSDTTVCTKISSKTKRHGLPFRNLAGPFNTLLFPQEDVSFPNSSNC